MKKALYHRIIEAVPTAAHDSENPVATDQVAVIPPAVNAAAVGMHDDTVVRLPKQV